MAEGAAGESAIFSVLGNVGSDSSGAEDTAPSPGKDDAPREDNFLYRGHGCTVVDRPGCGKNRCCRDKNHCCHGTVRQVLGMVHWVHGKVH